MVKTKAGFSLAELIIVVAIIAAFTVVAVPRLGYSAIFGRKSEAAAMRVVSAVRRTRAIAISAAAENTSGCELEFSTSAEGVVCQIKNSSTSDLIETITLDPDVNVSWAGGGVYAFEPLGNLSLASETSLTVSAGSDSFDITITQATGAVSLVKN